MKRLIHRNNRAFWIRACTIAIKNICKIREEKQEEYLKLSKVKRVFEAEPNPKNGLGIYWQEEEKIEKIRDLFYSYYEDGICLTDEQMNLILFYSNLEYHYKNLYDKGMDMVIRTYDDRYDW